MEERSQDSHFVKDGNPGTEPDVISSFNHQLVIPCVRGTTSGTFGGELRNSRASPHEDRYVPSYVVCNQVPTTRYTRISGTGES